MRREFSGNEQLERLASTGGITNGPRHGRTEMFRGLRTCLGKERPKLLRNYDLKEGGGDQGSTRQFGFTCGERHILNQTTITSTWWAVL